MWTGDEITNDDDPRSFRYQLKQLIKETTWKISGLNGIRTHDLCDTGAAL